MKIGKYLSLEKSKEGHLILQAKNKLVVKKQLVLLESVFDSAVNGVSLRISKNTARALAKAFLKQAGK